MEYPPRPTSKINLPEETIIRKNVHGGRADVFLKTDTNRIFGIASNSSITQIFDETQTFHDHELVKMDYSKPNEIACFHCCHSFGNHPFPVPNSFDAFSQKFVVGGNFCSPSCAKAFLLEKPNNSSKLSLFNKMMIEVYECDATTIRIAPPRFSLQLFGGVLTIDKFREGSQQFSISSSPFINSYTIITEKNQVESTSQQVHGSIKGFRRPVKQTGLIFGVRPAKSPYEKFLEESTNEEE